MSTASPETGPVTETNGLLTPGFGAWLGAETLSATGDGVLFFAIAWTATGLGAQVAGVILTIGLLPSVVLAVIGGALADRWGLRRTIIGANLAMCLLLGLFLGLEDTPLPTAVLLGGLSVADGLVSSVQRPANSAFPRLFFTDEMLSRGMSLTGSVLQVARLAGPPLGGVVVAALAMDGAAEADLISFVAIMGVLAVVRPPLEPPSQMADGSSTLRRASAGVSAAWRTPGAVPILGAIAIVAGSLLPMLSLCVPLLIRERGWGAGTAGVIEACWIAGSLTLSLLIAKLGTGSRPAAALAAGPMLSAVGIVVISLAPSPLIAYTGSVVMGVGTILFTSHAFPHYIRMTPPGMLARFQALLLVAQYLPTLIANNLLGTLSANLGPARAMWLLAATCAGAGVLVLTCSSLRRGTRALASDRQPVEGIERGDPGEAEERYEESEQRARGEPAERELESSSDRSSACPVKRLTEEPVAGGVLPNRIEAQSCRVECEAVEDDRGAQALAAAQGAGQDRRGERKERHDHEKQGVEQQDDPVGHKDVVVHDVVVCPDLPNEQKR